MPNTRRLTIVITLDVEEDLENDAILAEIRSHLDSVPGFRRADVQLLRSSMTTITIARKVESI